MSQAELVKGIDLQLSIISVTDPNTGKMIAEQFLNDGVSSRRCTDKEAERGVGENPNIPVFSRHFIGAFVGMQDKGIYSKPVDELVAQKSKFVGKPVRAEGNLVHGSLVKRDSPSGSGWKPRNAAASRETGSA